MTKWISRAGMAGICTAASLGGFAGAAAAAGSCQPEKFAETYPGLAGKVIRIGVDPQTPPYVMRDGTDLDKLVGFDADLARAVFDCAGAEVEFVSGAWSGLLPALIAGQIDVFWDNLYYTPARAEQVDYVVYMQAGTGALARAGNPKKVESIETLCGTTVAVGVGTVEEPQVKAQNDACIAAGSAGVEVMTFPDVAAGVRLVKSGRADVMLYDLALIDGLVADDPASFTRAFSILSGFGIGAAVRNDSGDLLQLIADNLKLVQDSGRQDEIFGTYKMDPALGLPAEVKTE